MINVAAAVIRHRDVGMIGNVSMIGGVRFDSEGWTLKTGTRNRVWFVALPVFFSVIPLYADTVTTFSYIGITGNTTDYTFTTCIHPFCHYAEWLAMAYGEISLYPFGKRSFA